MDNNNKKSLKQQNNLDTSLSNTKTLKSSSKSKNIGWIKGGIVASTMFLSSILGAQEASEEVDEVSCQNLNIECISPAKYTDGLNKLIPLSEICTSKVDIKRNILAESMPKNSISMLKFGGETYLHIDASKLPTNSEKFFLVKTSSKEYPYCTSTARVSFEKDSSSVSDSTKPEVKSNLEFLIGKQISVVDILKQDPDFTANYFVKNKDSIENSSSGDIIMLYSQDGLFVTPTLVGNIENEHITKPTNFTTKDSNDNLTKNFASIKYIIPKELIKPKAEMESVDDETSLVKENLKKLNLTNEQQLTVGGNVGGNSDTISGGADIIYTLEKGNNSFNIVGKYSGETTPETDSGLIGASYDFDSKKVDFGITGTFEGSLTKESVNDNTDTESINSESISESSQFSGKIYTTIADKVTISAEGSYDGSSYVTETSGSNTTVDPINETWTEDNGISVTRTGELTSTTEYANSESYKNVSGEVQGTIDVNVIDKPKTKLNISAGAGVQLNNQDIENETSFRNTTFGEYTTEVFDTDGNSLDSNITTINPITGETITTKNPTDANSTNVFGQVSGNLELNLSKAYIDLFGLVRVNGLNNEVKRSEEYHRFQGALLAYTSFNTTNNNKIIAAVDASRTDVENAGLTLGFLVNDKDGKVSKNIGDHFKQSLGNEFSSVSQNYSNALSQEYFTKNIANNIKGVIARGNLEKSSANSFLKGVDGVNGGAEVLVGLPYVTIGANASSGNAYSNANQFGGSVYLKPELFEKMFKGNYSPSMIFGVQGTQGINDKKGHIQAKWGLSFPLQKNKK